MLMFAHEAEHVNKDPPICLLTLYNILGSIHQLKLYAFSTQSLMIMMMMMMLTVMVVVI